jgi:hypothetical protein
MLYMLHICTFIYNLTCVCKIREVFVHMLIFTLLNNIDITITFYNYSVPI